MSPPAGCPAARQGRFPRVSGDEPSVGGSGEVGDVFSPRERG